MIGPRLTHYKGLYRNLVFISKQSGKVYKKIGDFNSLIGRIYTVVQILPHDENPMYLDIPPHLLRKVENDDEFMSIVRKIEKQRDLRG